MGYVVVATFPTMDTAVTVGPFRSAARAESAYDEMTSRGWNAEVCELQTIDEVAELTGYDAYD
jgi:hypothetical protein